MAKTATKTDEPKRLSWDEIQAKAVTFSKKWNDSHREKADAQPFVIDFLRVFGVDDPDKVGEREKPVKITDSHDQYIDFFWKGQIAIEMKSRDTDDASGKKRKKKLEDAYVQLKGYMDRIPDEDVPDLWMVCNFETIQLWRRSTKEIFTLKLKDFRKHIKLFANIAGYTTERIREEQVEVNVKAAEKMAKLHDALKDSGYAGHDLEVYLVRLLFCLFAGDTGIFPKDSLFGYLAHSKSDGSDLSERLGKLFEVLNMSNEVRDKKKLLSEELKQFRYINGRLFESVLPMADFDATMRQTLLDCANFDWHGISPAIFGAMFQGVMDKEQRRELGAHYTSEENILKLINPLFMDELWKEFDKVKTSPPALEQFHGKISRLKFLDPACGCGNFLIITYRELRKLELEILKMTVSAKQRVLDVSPMLKVNVEQFYGIELEDFPCQIAQVGMWLMDHQMNLRVSEQFGHYITRLPLTQSATIVHGNALRIDWECVVQKEELSYILGNPPFVGHQYRTVGQQADMRHVYHNNGKSGKLDYVCCWYKKAVDFTVDTHIQTAFVSTNSIVQGESVSVMWKPIFEQGLEISFAYTPFVWSNEAKGKAAVHCVIIGLAQAGRIDVKRIIGQNVITKTTNINGYLLPAPNIFIQSRGKPLTIGIPEMSKGSQPTDGGNLILSTGERQEFIVQYPKTVNWIKLYVGSDEFINGIARYCLWLKGVAPTEYRTVKPIMQRLERVSESRKASPTISVRRDADTPMLFTQIRQPETRYLAVPETSSERRKYIPIGYLTSEVIASNKLYVVPDATLFMFGIMISCVHMAWTRVVCGRLEMRYSYSPAVYNNFPWPEASGEQKGTIETLAQAVLDVRSLYPESSLADLYDPLTMPPELLKAHQNLDRAVVKLYGFKKDITEPEIVAALMERYQELVESLD
jgi:hypothetical protein